MTPDELHAFLHEHTQARGLPASVYRLQLSKDFRFRHAAGVAPFLRQLGISAAYCSPWFAAVPGSAHGYDVTDYGSFNPELGTEEDFSAWSAALAAEGLRQVIDMVPNHMGIGAGNRLWFDVLENGQASVYARFFDINWDPVKKELRDKVLIPILGDYYGRVLEGQQIRLLFEDGAFRIRYGAHLLPVAPETYPLVLCRRLQALRSALGEDSPDLQELLSIATSLRNLPPRTEADSARIAERCREKEVAKARLRALAARSPSVRGFLEEEVRLFNGIKGSARSFDPLDQLLGQQVYRMAHWMVAADEINFRRFFDVNDLAAIRMEDPAVFAYCHRLVFRLIAEGKVHGLRIDHPDGLYDPPTYFRSLQRCYLAQAVLAQSQPPGPAEPPWPESLSVALSSREFFNATPLLVEAEKVLDRKESLPENWSVHGTVGYDFLNALNGLFVEQGAEKAFTALYEGFIGHPIDFEELVYTKKKRFALLQMSSEIEDLGHRLDRLSERSRRYRDFTRSHLVLAIRETIASFPVYRTYISPEDVVVSDRDAKYVLIATEKAKSCTPALDPEVYDFLREVLLLRLEGEFGEEGRTLYRDFIMRFQQLSGPVMAKGLEDTAFYVYNRLLSLNEVGGDPTHFGVSREDFHHHNALRAKRWPASFITASTHDTKRSEDVRLRLDVLSELSGEWQTMIAQWALANKKHKVLARGDLQPGPNTEYMIYQTLLGVWPDRLPDDLPAFQERLWAYVRKAVREAKSHTNWMHPNLEYEEAVRSFLLAVMTPGEGNHFLESFIPFRSRVADLGRWNSLSALVLRLGSPGIVDIYQGTELWDLSLVDPDNRRPVDFVRRREALAQMASQLAGGVARQVLLADLVAGREDGRIKLYLLWQGLTLRERRPGLFVGGEYQQLETTGQRDQHIVSFMRRDGRDLVVVAGGRFFSQLSGPEGLPAGETVWTQDAIQLPDSVAEDSLREIFSGRMVPVRREGGRAFLRASEVFGSLSAAMLTNVPET